MQSVDSTTGGLPANPMAGFLPPNTSANQGTGYVTFSVKPVTGLANGTTISNQATIVFDVNAAINTNTVTNTIDSVYPISSVNPLPSTSASASFPVSWSGSDPAGAGIASYNIFVSVNNGPYSIWLPSTTATSATYTGAAGQTYSFYSMATDNVGHTQQTAGAAQTTTTTAIQMTTPAITWATPARITYGTALSAVQLDATASVPGTFVYSPVAGTVLAAGTQTLSVTFTPTDTIHYTTATGTVSLTVNPAATPSNSVPGIASLNPVVTKAGSSDFTLTVTGVNFVSGAVVQWNGSNRTTAWVSATQLTASITAADVGSVGTAKVTVVNPSPGGGTSGVFELAIDSATGTGGAAVSAQTTTLNVTAGQTVTLPVSFTGSSSTPAAALSVVATCIDLPVGTACSYDNGTRTVTITTSASTPPGSYQVVAIFTIATQTARATYRPVMVAMWGGLMGLPLGLLWIGGSRKKAVRCGAITLLGLWLILSLVGCGTGTKFVPIGPAASTQSSVAITLNVK
jgi:hypothetical protein